MRKLSVAGAMVVGAQIAAFEAAAEENGLAVQLAIAAIGAAVKAYGEGSAEAVAAEDRADALFGQGEGLAARLATLYAGQGVALAA